jgi:hypothetical protein
MSQRTYIKYRKLQDELGLALEREELTRERVRLTEMVEEKSLDLYKDGEITYEDLMDRRVERVEACLRAMESVQQRVNINIDIATLAGGLSNYNANIRY